MSVAKTKLAMMPTLRFPEFEEDWWESRLDDATTRRSGHTPNQQRPEYWDGGIKWVSLADSNKLDDGLIETTKKEISALGIANSSAVLLSPGSVILSRDAGVGKSAIIASEMAVSQHFIAWSCEDKGQIHNWFLYHWLQIRKEYFERQAVGSTIKTIGLPLFKKLALRHPSLTEQRKIGDFIGAVDGRLALLRRRRGALRNYKKGMMQRLFSQELRFTHDDGTAFSDWQEKRLGEVFDERSERSNQQAELLSVRVNDGIRRLRDLDRRDNSSEDKSNYKVVRIGDIAYNSMRMWQGASGLSRFDGIVSPAYTVIICQSGNLPNFWGYYFKLPSLIHQFQRHSQGLTSDTWNLKFPALASIKVSCPIDPEEQKKIAEALVAFDRKIDANERQIATMHAFKKALLQQMFV
jgi:type I restriction enzyme S subunit